MGRALGIRFAAETLGTLYQYLDPSILQDDLLRGLRTDACSLGAKERDENEHGERVRERDRPISR